MKTSSQNKGAYPISSPELIGPERLKLFEDILNVGLTLRVKVTGKSMAPVLQGGEILTINKTPSCSLHIGDLIYFKTLYGVPLLHRIVGKQREKDMFIFQTKGDALITMDQPVTEHSIIGKACRIEKLFSGGRTKQIEMESGTWKVINYFQAMIGLGRSKVHILLRSGLFSSFRHVIKKFLFNPVLLFWSRAACIEKAAERPGCVFFQNPENAKRKIKKSEA